VFADCVTLAAGSVEQLRGLAIADAYARFLRAQGCSVLFSLGFDVFGASVEQRARAAGTQPREWVGGACERLRAQLEALGVSCDWDRVCISSDAGYCARTQRLFLELLEHDLVYRRERRWLMRIDRYVAASERALETLAGWDAEAIASQRSVLERVEGVEIDAGTFTGGPLTVFTPHADAIAQARFVAVSPQHPDVEGWVSEPEIARRVAAMRSATSREEGDSVGEIPLVVTGQLATVPGVAGIVPIVVSPLVDARFGPTAVLGIPDLDATDRAIAERLPTPAGAAWKTSNSGSATRAAVRYRITDLPVSRAAAWGAPVPLVECSACGVVPVPHVELPVLPPEELSLAGEDESAFAARADFYECVCPRCASPAHRETTTIDPRLDRMWMWMALCLPAERRAGAPAESSLQGKDTEYARWLPADLAVASIDAAESLFERRLLAVIAHELRELPPLPGREPFTRALLHQPLRLEPDAPAGEFGDVSDLDTLLERIGADAVRLTLLHGASPRRAFTWSEQPLRQSERFLRRLHAFALPRARDWTAHSAEVPRIDTSSRLRRRLARWCEVACEKVTPQLEHLELQRAAHNAILLASRIEDFEARALEYGDPDARDREAVVAALLVLASLLAPMTPHMAEELWSAAGGTAPIGQAPWPSLSRAARTAGARAADAGQSSCSASPWGAVRAANLTSGP
jgi:leucyl-tRNA synthetase